MAVENDEPLQLRHARHVLRNSVNSMSLAVQLLSMPAKKEEAVEVMDMLVRGAEEGLHAMDQLKPFLRDR